MVLISLKGLRPGLLLGLRMQRAQPADVDDELLAFGAEAPVLEQPGRVRIGRVLEDAVGPHHQRRALGGIDRLDRPALLLELKQIVFIAVGLHRPLAERELLRRIGRRLHLHHVLLRELLEILPAEIAGELLGRRHDRAAVARVRLDHLALPLRIEQIGEALRRLLGLHQAGVEADHAQADAEAREQAVGVLVLGGIVLGHVLGDMRRQDPLCAPDDEMRRVRRVDDVHGGDAAGILLRDALEHALGAAALDPHADAGEFRLEGLGDLLGHRQVDRGVVDDLALFLRRRDQVRRDRGGRRRGCQNARRCQAERERGRALQNVAAGDVFCMSSVPDRRAELSCPRSLSPRRRGRAASHPDRRRLEHPAPVRTFNVYRVTRLAERHTLNILVYCALISVALLLDRRGVVLHDLDLVHRLAAGLVLDQLMRRAQAADLDVELLAFAPTACSSGAAARRSGSARSSRCRSAR